MLGSLKRVLRIRALQEERSRMELEVEAGRLREIESGSAAAARQARESRERSFAGMGGQGAESAAPGAVGPGWGEGNWRAAVESDGVNETAPRRDGDWREAEASWEAAISRRDGFEARRPERESSVARARTEFLAGRRERLQAETLVEAAAAREAREQGRKEQRGLDDWFQSWARRVREKEASGG